MSQTDTPGQHKPKLIHFADLKAPMQHTLLWFLLLLVLSGCSQLDSIQYAPAQTPETWLKIQPSLELALASHKVLIVQPSTSLIVYLLGLVSIGAGSYFLRNRAGQRSRVWWGVALLLWGLGAILAGTSYEAFSYQIKCAGREACIWTSGWEIAYLLLSVASVDAMLLAEAFSCAGGGLRRFLISYALANFGVYLTLVMVGVLIPLKFLISFELLIMVCAPTIALFLALNGWRYARFKQPLDLALLGAWGWLIFIIAAYFGYYLAGWTQVLWERGTWFSENDVLHIGLILWMLYLARVVGRKVADLIAE